MQPVLSIAYFVTPHGFGHAARAAAVMNAIYSRWPFVHFDIFTLTPEWFFNNSLKAPYTHHLQQTDIGLIQTSPLHFDLDKTADALDAFLPFDEKRLAQLADKLCAAGCHLVISDISPLGIAVAKHAGICSVLVENFTWDWIYEPYARKDPRFQKHADILAAYYSEAGLRVQAAPMCRTLPDHPCTPPIARTPTADPLCTRENLGIGSRDKMVLITMGGIDGDLPFIERLSGVDNNICFVVPGASKDLPIDGVRLRNVIFLPQNAVFYHPDLVNAADAVVGKVGYSTLAEVYHAGAPYGFVPRPDFRESPVFESYIQQNMSGIKFSEREFISGDWLNRLPGLLQMPAQAARAPSGADAAAGYICDYLAREKEFAYQYIHSNEFESELVFTYTCRHDGPIVFNPEEIDAVKFWETTEIEANLGAGVLSDNFEDEFKRYRQWLARQFGNDT